MGGGKINGLKMRSAKRDKVRTGLALDWAKLNNTSTDNLALFGSYPTPGIWEG